MLQLCRYLSILVISGGAVVSKKPGCILVEFQEPIHPGLDRETFNTLLSNRIHDGNRKLLSEIECL